MCIVLSLTHETATPSSMNASLPPPSEMVKSPLLMTTSSPCLDTREPSAAKVSTPPSGDRRMYPESDAMPPSAVLSALESVM